MKKILVSSIIIMGIFSCTDNTMVRRYGGNEEVALKKNEKLLNVSWKEEDLWVLTIDTTTQIKYFREKSRLGVFEGEISFK